MTASDINRVDACGLETQLATSVGISNVKMVSGRLRIPYLADNQNGKVLGEAAWRPGSRAIVTREPAPEHPRSAFVIARSWPDCRSSHIS